MKSVVGATEFERLPLVAGADADSFEGMMFRLDKDTEYFVESNGVTSTHHKLTVVDLPTVKQLDVEYHFPAYTNLPPRKEENGGDVAALRGTSVLLHITPTMKTSGGQILFKEGAAVPLSVGGWHARRQLRCHSRLLPHRAHRPQGREGRSLAAVHD
jgi:hypothetical protein